MNLTLCRPDSNIVKRFVDLPVRFYLDKHVTYYMMFSFHPYDLVRYFTKLTDNLKCSIFLIMISSCGSPYNEQCSVLCVWSTNSHTRGTRHSHSAYYIMWHLFQLRIDIACTGHGVHSPSPDTET